MQLPEDVMRKPRRLPPETLVIALDVPPPRKTRSGREFSPYTVKGITARDGTVFDFGALVQQAGAAADYWFSSGTHAHDTPAAEDAASSVDINLTPVAPDSPAQTLLPPPTTASASPPCPVPPVVCLTSSTALKKRAQATYPTSLKNKCVELAYRKQKAKQRARLKRQQIDALTAPAKRVLRPSSCKKHTSRADAGHPTTLDAFKLRHARTAYVGIKTALGPKTIYSREEIIEQGIEIVLWNAKQSMPILDRNKRVIGVCLGRPEASDWGAVIHEASCAILAASCLCTFAPDDLHHRRGGFPALAVGASYGGGQTVPGNLKNGANTEVLHALCENPAIMRIAGFASAAVALWAPKLYAFYVDRLGKFYRRYTTLRRNFRNSIFACATFNFGPATVTYDHVDYGNLPFGWCAITALGDFDHTRGGHLILWDLMLAIEFPPGATILIPSGALRHGNTSLQPGEVRYSFTQYAAGGLFRWVEHGFVKEEAYKAGWSKARMAQEEVANAQRWAEAAKMFSTMDELVAEHM
ncbi:hypothetical protein HWV62_9851 [Athelia sp. TMB]|nr:hypothetical protein HWV62_9851 [Athelia sp. TMB]